MIIVDIACDTHVLLNTDEGHVYSFGLGTKGQLGLGSTTAATSPSIVDHLKGKKVSAVSCGKTHSIAITSDGSLFSWGANKNSQLGHPEMTKQEAMPKQVQALNGKKIVKAACGTFHSLAVDDAGVIYAWGAGSSGQLGMGDKQDIVKLPKAVDALSGEKVLSVSTGGAHTVICTESGAVYAWGWGMNGQLGLGDKTEALKPVKLESLQSEKFVKVVCGEAHSMACTDTGKLFTWGWNFKGQIGHKGRSEVNMPMEVKSLSGVQVCGMSGGGTHSIICSKDGHAYTCGAGSCGQLGHGNLNDVQQFELVQTLDSVFITKVAAGTSHSMAISKDGAVFSWGRGYDGQLGLGQVREQLNPRQLDIGGVKSNSSSLVGSNSAPVGSAQQKNGAGRVLPSPRTQAASKSAAGSVNASPKPSPRVGGAAGGGGPNGAQPYQSHGTAPQTELPPPAIPAMTSSAFDDDDRSLAEDLKDIAVSFSEVHTVSKIGEGGFATVYRGLFRLTDVAIKIIKPRTQKKHTLDEFRAEVLVMMQLRHPNILMLLGACVVPPNLCIITELLPRGSLYDVLHVESLKVGQKTLFLRMAKDIACGLHYLHCCGIFHRDLKSDNVLVDTNLNCKVCDFGLAKVSKRTNSREETGVFGSPNWAAPEVLAREQYTDRSDVYSYGVVLWEMLTGKYPYSGLLPAAIEEMVVQKGHRLELPDDVSAPLRDILSACWTTNPNDRPTMKQVWQKLNALS